MTPAMYFLLWCLCSTLLVEAAASSQDIESVENGWTTEFSKAADLQEKRIVLILHPVLHGCAEKRDSLFARAKKSIEDIGGSVKECDLIGVYTKVRKSSPEVLKILNAICGGVVGRFAGMNAERLLFHSGFYHESESSSESRTAAASLAVMRSAEKEIKDAFPTWKEETECSKGVLECPKLGNYSKDILANMFAFFRNIRAYENRTGHPYFGAKGCMRIFTFIASVTTRICEANVRHAILAQDDSGPQDKQLKNYLKVVDYLLGLPTEMHNPEPYWEKNYQAIDAMLSFLPLAQQREMYDYMNKLLTRAQDPNYGHQDGNAGINLLLSGSSGTGKTYVGKKLPILLGFNPIIIKLEELQRGQDRSCNNLENLVEGGKLSGLEIQLLRFDKTEKRSLTPCNPVCFIDEIEGYQGLKDQLDQFKRIRLPSLGVEIPAFLNCTFTTNHENFLRDPALISRFVQIRFPKMTADKKIEILAQAMDQQLRQRYPQQEELLEELMPFIDKAVKFDERINIRILIDNVDCIINFISTKQAVQEGRGYLVPVQDRIGVPESYDEFLQRKFGNLDLGRLGSDLEDSDTEA